MSKDGNPGVAVKVFTFEENRERLSVSIPEVLDPQYGMYVWPCAVVLAQYVWTARTELLQKTVLELGAGVALPGVVAAKCGAKVVLTDGAELPLCLENCRQSCRVNNLHDVRVEGLTWGEASPEVHLLPPADIILGSDVFYEPEDFENIILTVTFLLRKNPQAKFWTTYQERSSDWSIEGLLHKWNLKCKNIPLQTFHADRSHLAGSHLPGCHSIQMMIISMDM
ncbi:histone-arginine methyltransferase METTL23 [Denticeps clupeoides]|uniref:Methyltransferase-like protein 23 n=1 Tax=Denticeps clupeoides TaxID=299321 RepID=A0AAY4AQ96_9TELE|nr:methyltransferase-like protein 23 [Denticeps clupeoides]